MLGHREDAEDMAQETFVRVLRSLARWDQERDFEPWLLAIAGNRYRSLLAKRTRRPAVYSLENEIPDDAGDLQAAGHLAEEIQHGLSRIREEYRQAFLLFHQEELSYAEIGQVMNVPLGTVKTWVHRARGQLIQRLQKRGVVQEYGHAMRKV